MTCQFPFYQLLLQPNGDVSPCCWNQKLILGNIKRQNLDEIWNGDQIKSLRREFISNRPVTCQKYMDEIGCHLKSQRDFPIPNQIHISEPPRRLDLRLNGRCNLKCIMCDVWSQKNGTYDETSFWTKGPIDIFPYLREIDMLGGEPFFQRDTFKLIEEVSRVNSQCSWAFVTNGNYSLQSKIKSALDGIRIRFIQVSIDSLNEDTYGSIRVGGLLSKSLKTLNDFISYRNRRILLGNGFKLFVSFCVQQRNWTEVEDFILFAIRNKVALVLQFAYEPSSASLLGLDDLKRKSILLYFEKLRISYGAIVDPILLPLKNDQAEFGADAIL